MKIKYFIPLIILIFNTTLLNAQKLNEYVGDFPEYTEIINNFYDKYYPKKNYPEDQLLQFARDMNGWYVLLINQQTRDTNTIIFWDIVDTYHEMNEFNQKKENTDTAAFSYLMSKDFINNWDNLRMFRLHTFYGYNNWHLDIIKLLGPISNKLNDEDMYSLGRAYSLESGEIIKQKYNKNSKNLFLKYNLLARNCFEKITNRNPYFYDIVGKIRTKYANEFMTAYNLFFRFGYLDKKKFIVSNIYPREIISDAKNYLNNCPFNSILLTNGDNDSYPVWYVQEFYNFRKDVTVINLSLLFDKNYINELKSKKYLNLGIKKNIYDSIVYFIFDKFSSNNSLTFDSFLIQLDNLNIHPNENVCQFDSKVFWNNNDSQIYNYPYVDIAQIACVDIVNSNKNRPICITDIEYGNQIFGNHFINLGVIYLYKPSDSNRISIDSFLNFLNLMDTTGYCTNGNYPKRPGTEEFIDEVFIQKIYYSLIMAIEQMNYNKNEEKLAKLKFKWNLFSKNWVVKPFKEYSEYYKNSFE